MSDVEEFLKASMEPVIMSLLPATAEVEADAVTKMSVNVPVALMKLIRLEKANTGIPIHKIVIDQLTNRYTESSRSRKSR